MSPWPQVTVQAFQIWMGPTAGCPRAPTWPHVVVQQEPRTSTQTGCGRAMDKQMVPSHGLGPDASIVPGSTVGADLYNPIRQHGLQHPGFLLFGGFFFSVYIFTFF